MDDKDYKRLVVLLEDVRDTTKKTHSIVRKMRRDAIIGHIFKIVIWLVILGFPFALYYYYKPTIDEYIEQYQKIYNAAASVDLPFSGE